MRILNSTTRNVLIVCLLAAPLLQLIGDGLWVSRNFSYSWSIWREASYIFFIPVGFLLAKIIGRKSNTWAMIACAFYVVGCFGSAAMMPLFRLSGFYPVHGHNEFPAVVQSVLNKNAFGFTLFLPGLCLPISLLLFGIGFLKYRLFHPLTGIAFIVSGLLFWFGNAIELDAVLIVGDAWLLALFGFIGFVIHRESKPVPERNSLASAV